MALHPLFRLGNQGQVTGGYRSLLAFWIGGAANPQAAPEQPQEQPQAPQPQPAGGVYAPRKRKPERLVFLEREILEKREREQERRAELKRLAQEAQARTLIEVQAERAQIEQRRFAIEAEIQELQTAISAIQQKIAFEIELQQQIEQDEEDAIAVILMAATLH